MSQHPVGGPDGGPVGGRVKVSRSPRFTRFLITGGVVGLLIGVLLSLVGHPDARYDVSVAMGFLGLVCALLGVLVGGVIAVLIDRRS